MSTLRFRTSLALAVVFTGSWCLSPANAGEIDLDAIRAAIEARDLQWYVADTQFSRFPRDVREGMMGTIPDADSPVVDEVLGTVLGFVRVPAGQRTKTATRDLPASLDWRSYDGSNWVTEPKDQGTCGSCWDFSLVGAWESRILLQRNEPVRSTDKSEQFILSCSAGTCAGWSIARAAGFVYTTGCPDESCFPYGPPYDARPCGDACSDWADTADTLNTGAYLTSTDDPPTAAQVAAIKTALLSGPVATSMFVYDDFFSYGGGIYEYAWGDSVGGHGVVFVGWDDTSMPPCWICKNSWGPSWGESGFFRIAMGEPVSRIGRWTYEVQHYEPLNEMQLCVEDTLGTVGYGSSSPSVRYGGVEYTVPVSGRVTAIMTRFQEMDMTYTVYVYDGISGSGTPGTLLSSTSGSLGSSLGWRRIDLDTPVHLTSGSDVFVAVRYGTIAYAVPLESLDPGDNSGRSWYSSTGSSYSNLVSYGDICVRAMMATASPAPPDTVMNLAVSFAGSDVHLSWSAVTSDTTGAPTLIDHYAVYRSEFAYFDEGSATVIATPSTTSFTDLGAVGDPNVDHFYAVAAVDDFGTPSLLNRRVGEIDRDLP